MSLSLVPAIDFLLLCLSRYALAVSLHFQKIQIWLDVRPLIIFLPQKTETERTLMVPLVRKYY